LLILTAVSFFKIPIALTITIAVDPRTPNFRATMGNFPFTALFSVICLPTVLGIVPISLIAVIRRVIRQNAGGD